MKITAAYLAWKRAGSPGVWCLRCDCPAEADHVHAQQPWSRGITPAELAWHRSRPQPVTGSAFKDDPTCIQTPINGDVIQQLQMEEDRRKREERRKRVTP